MAEIQIIPYSELHYNAVKHIILSSFSKTAYHTDSAFTKEQADQFLWARWGKPALQGKNPHCFTAVYNEQAAGFLIYGIFQSLRKKLQFPIGNIILLAADTRFQNSKLKIGTKLVRHILQYFSDKRIPFATVGTDLDNLAAIKLYQKNHFYIALPWSTYRWHSAKHTILPAEAVSDFPIDFKALKLPPNSFLEDNFFSSEEKSVIIEVMVLNIKEKIQSNTADFLSVKEGAVIYQAESVSEISAVLIKIIGYYGDLFSLLKLLQNRLAKQYTNFIIEFFVKSNDWEIIKELSDNQFALVHNAVTMHCRL